MFISRGFRVCAVAAVGAILISACGSETANPDSADLTPVTFQLNWTGGGPNAGFAVAKADGFYERAGLDVELVQGTGSGPAVQLVASRQVDIAFADATAVSQLIAQGADMKVVATVYQASPNTVEALTDSGIRSIADLRGKQVGVPQGASNASMLPLLLEANGLAESDLDVVNLPSTSRVPALLQGEVDAILGGVDSSSVQLEQQHSDYEAFLWADHGVGTVAQSIFANDTYLQQNPEVMRKFVAASLQGWVSAMQDPEHAAEALKEVFPDVVEDTALLELKGIIPLLCSSGARFVGRAEPENWTRTQDLLSRVDLLPAGQDPASYYTYEFLPAESDLTPCPVV